MNIKHTNKYIIVGLGEKQVAQTDQYDPVKTYYTLFIDST